MKKYTLIMTTVAVLLLGYTPSIVKAQGAEEMKNKTVESFETKNETKELQDYQLKESYEVVYDNEFLTAGEDIPAGKYRVVSENVGYVFDLDGEQNVIRNLLVFNWSYIELDENQSIRLKEVFLTPLTEEMAPVTNEEVITDGIYLVGTDIESGTYSVLSTEIESALAIFNTFDLNDFNNASFPSPSDSNITVEEGQLLSIAKVEISK